MGGSTELQETKEQSRVIDFVYIEKDWRVLWEASREKIEQVFLIEGITKMCYKL